MSKLPQEGFRERQASVLIHLLDRVQDISLLHGKKFEEVFGNDANIRNFIKELNSDVFIEILSGINGILRGKEKENWKMDGGIVEISAPLLPRESIPPLQEQKRLLFSELVILAKKMNESNRTREDIALLLGTTINSIHAFLDGNGRTSRFVYLLVKNGYSQETKEELEAALLNDGREFVDPNPSLIRNQIEERLLIDPLEDPTKNPARLTSVLPDVTSKEFVFGSDVSEVVKNKFLDLVRNAGSYFRLAIIEELYQRTDIEEYVQEFPGNAFKRAEIGTSGELSQPTRRVLMLSRLTPRLDNVSLENVLNRYWALKKEYVEMVMDSIANPDKEQYLFEINGEKIKLIDLLKMKIKPNSV